MKTLALLLTILLVPFLLRAQIVHIPDANFKAALVGNSSINTNGDDEIQVSEAEAYTGGIYVDNQGIADMTGLEAFTLLQYLDCSDNQLTSLDVSANTALTILWCESNQLASLDVSANTALEQLNCSSNQLTSLNVSGNTAIQTLLCGRNQLTNLDLSANTALTSLSCYSNQLTGLDVSANTALTRLDCWSNQLHSLNVRNGNNASIINFNAALNPALSCITVSDVAYAEANWTNIDEGVIFSEGGCNVYIPDANFKAALLADDAINTIDDSEIQYREAETYSGSIYVPNLSIADMTGLEAFKSVTGLDCSANNLSQLVVRQNARIVSIDCGNNELGSLDVSLNPALETLNCASNQLKGLELSNTNNLRQLDCQSNQLEILDLSDNVKLTELYCQSNQLRSLDVKNGNNEQITAFDARNNPSLSCIAVDDEAYSAANWPNVDAEGLFNEEGCAVVYIPDAGFKAALLANTGINTNWDTEIQVSEAKAYTGDIQVPSTGISDMTGLEAFTKLTTLDCSGNQLSELDMKANELLIQLNCSNNQLGRLALRSNQLLEQLDCSNNQLSRLALRSNPLLEQLDCSNNQLELLDLRMNSALKEMLCQSNQLHSLDLRNGANEAITAFDATVNPTLICITVDDADYAESNWSGIDDGTVFSEDGCNVHIPDANFKAALVGNSSINTNGDDEVQVSEAEAYDGGIYVYDQGIADMTGLEAFTLLQYLDCSDNQLTSLDVSANTALTILWCESNQLASLDVSANTALTYFDCSRNQLTSLDLSANTALTILWCESNQLASLDVSANTMLTSLDCEYNQLTSLDVSANTALTSLSCYSNQLTGLDVSANAKLYYLLCYSNQLTSLDVSANAALTYLDCRSNQLTSLDVSENALLEWLICPSNQLTNLDLSANTALTYLDCEYNQLTSLDVSENALLEQLDCERNQLTSLDVSANALLEQLICDNNQLTSLDLVGNKILELLYCGSNQLTSLDVSANVTLELLYCYSNQLTSLDISTNTALTELSCGENQLTSLDVSANTTLRHLDCSSNQLTTLDVSANTELTTFRCYSNQLHSLNVRNGNNASIINFNAALNPALSCITVSDVAYAEANWTNIDEGVIFSEGGCNVYIPDANFKAALLADDAINTIDDSEIQYREAETYSGSIYVPNLSIADMTGLEAFKSVTGLDCSANNLSQLVVRQNARIVSIDCGNNELGSLDVSLNPALETLNCASNQLKGLELSNTNNLRQLDCQSNQLEILDLSDNVKLTELYCQSNQLRSLDVKNGNNEQITAFDARNNPSLSCIAVDDEAYSAANWPNVDAEGLFNEEGCAVVYIPDAGFKAALLANTSINTNSDAEIQYSEAAVFTGMMDVHALEISDMTGLEAFTGLSGLDCSSNLLNELDVASNELLTQLNCSNNQLSRLALRSNPLLEQLDCSNNQLGLLDLRMNGALKDVLCQSNQLHSLDLRNGANEAITAFDATVNPTLICITVDDADYAESNWSGIDDGTVFSEDGCNVYIPDASFKAALVGNSSINTNGDDEIQVGEAEAYDGTIDVENKGITDMIGLEAFTALYVLDCQHNRLTSLDVSANTTLWYLNCDYNQLNSLDVSANTALTTLSCWSNQLTSLDVSANTALTSLSCYSNQLTGLDLSVNTALASLSCGSNQMTGLDVSSNTALTYLDCVRNQLTALDVSAQTDLEQLSCDSNQLTSLDVSANTMLTYLSCGGNQLTSLDVSANTELFSVSCSSNQLHSLYVRNGNNASIIHFNAFGNPALGCITVSDVAFAEANWTNIDPGVIFSEGGCNVYIPDPNFKAALLADAAINTNNDSEIQYGEAEAYTGSIEVENLAIADMTGLEAFKSITGLNCADNELTQLVLRYHTALESVDCSGNQLDALDMKANEALKSLNCASNQLTSLDVRNGHNTQITEFDATNNSSLNCISVDDANYSTVNWTTIDAHTSFNGDCYFIADFVADETSGPLPLEVQFTDRSDNTATSWQWDFGDGNTSEEQSPNHTYTVAGTYTVMLTISNGYKINIDSKIGYIDVLKRNQTITFGALDNKTFGDADFDLSATASSGLDVSYTSSDLTVATIDGNTVTIVGAGTTTITASQAGDDNYHAATDVQQTLTVGKAAQTITFGALDNKTFGDADFDLTVTASSGLDVSYTSSDLTVATIDGNTVIIVGAGTTTITASQAGDDNYNAATDVEQSLTVEKAAQTITFGALDNKTVLDPDFDLSATASSGLGVSYTSSDHSVATIAGSTVTIVGAGTTTITASQAGDDNYNAATEVQQTLTVEQAAQTITFGALDNKTVLDPDFDLSATASSGLGVSYTSSDLTVATIDGSTVIIVGAGTTTITASQAGDDNYLAATEVQQTLTVEKAAQTITFGDLDSKTVEDADFDLTATASSGLDVSYTSSDLTVATIDGNTVTIVGAGTTTITASQAGDDNYNAATDVQQSLTVEKAGQTITFGALDNKTVLDPDFDLTATASSGLGVSYTSSDLTVATIDGSTVTIVGAGTTTITASQAGNDNYHAATDVQQTLTVEKAAQTITFGALDNKTFGDADFDLTATASSGLDVSYTSSDLTVATIDGNTVTIVGAGTTTITASQAGNDNYNAATDVQQSLTVEKAGQTITFGALDNKTVLDPDFDLMATASSGLDVSYTSSDLTVATIDGSTVTIVGAGTTTITASQEGDDNYHAATDVQHTLTVEKAAQTITFGALDNKTFGDADFDLSATASSGLDVSYTSSDLTVATIDGSTVTIVGAGTTTITASQAGNDNYHAATEVQQTLTVEKAAQTITFGALDNKTFGDADFGLTATASSGLDVSYTSSDLTVATIDGNTVIIVGAGTTTITASQAGNDNYHAATDVQQTLTVEKAAQTITFGALDNKTFGDADFDLTATASSGLDVSYTSSDLTVATIDGNTVTIVGAGTTTITASQAGDDNYLAATEVQQTLTVEKAAQTITFEALDNKTFGDADFDLTATASSGLDVSYTSSDLTVATIDGNTVTIVGAGTTTITASQEGNDNYHAADPVAQTLEVTEITALTVEEDERILVYPNPASSTMILQFESGMRSIRMLNLNGQTVCEKHGIDKLAGRLEIDTSTYPPGEYIIRFEGKGKTTAKKVLISR